MSSKSHSPSPKVEAPQARSKASPTAGETGHETRIERLLWTLAAVLTFWSFGFTTMMGSDLWWHLASGRWILENRTLNFRDPWSFTHHGQPWMSHEWFSDVIFQTWARWFGMDSLVWWKWSVLVAAFLVLFLVLRSLSGRSLPAYLGSVLAMAVGAPFFDIRPQLYSVLGFALLLRIVLVPSRLRWTLPLLFFLWVNLHGGFFFGLIALTLVFALARLLGQGARNDLPLWLGCLAACLFNPSGPDAYGFPLHYAIHPGSPYLRVGEWRPPYEASGIRAPLFFPVAGVFVASVALTFLLRRQRNHPRWTWSALALASFTLAMSLKSRRFIPLFGITQSLLLAPLLADLFARLGARIRGPLASMAARPGARFVLPALALGFALWRLLPFPLSNRAFLYLTSQDNFPVEALNVVEANHLSGKVFSFYEWGGYVDLRTDGRLQVYIDGRADTVFDDQTYRRYTRVLNMAKGWEDVVNESGAEFFLWPRRSRAQLDRLRETGQWRALYTDHIAVLLGRADADAEVATPLRPSPDSPWRELALGWSAAGAKRLGEAERHFQNALSAMPNLRQACEWLANVQARADRMPDAEATLDHCQKLFPDSDRRKRLLAHFRSRSDALP